MVLQGKAFWLGGLDSNQDSQIQSLESYQLDDLPADENAGLTSYRDRFLWGKRGNLSKFCAKLRWKIGHPRKFVPHEIRPKMRVAANHFFAAVPNPLLNYLDCCPCHDQSAFHFD